MIEAYTSEDTMAAYTAMLVSQGFIASNFENDDIYSQTEIAAAEAALRFKKVDLDGLPDIIIDVFIVPASRYEDRAVFIRARAIPDDPNEVCCYTMTAVKDAIRAVNYFTSALIKDIDIKYNAESFMREPEPGLYSDNDGNIVVENDVFIYEQGTTINN